MSLTVNWINTVCPVKVYLLTHWMPSTHLPQDKGQHFIHNRYDKFTVDKGRKRKTFLNLIHCKQTNTTFFWTGKGQDNRKSCCTVQQEKKTTSRHECENWYLTPFSVRELLFLPLLQAQRARKTMCKDRGFSIDTYKFSRLISIHFLKELSV